MRFNSKRKFKLWNYTVSHNSLLLRSEIKFPDQEDYSIELSFNIDMEFSQVSFINIPTTINGIEIYLIDDEKMIPDFLRKELMYDFHKVFVVISNKTKYYIIAGDLLIGKNKWINKDRISHYGLNLKHDEIILEV